MLSRGDLVSPAAASLPAPVTRRSISLWYKYGYCDVQEAIEHPYGSCVSAPGVPSMHSNWDRCEAVSAAARMPFCARGSCRGRPGYTGSSQVQSRAGWAPRRAAVARRNATRRASLSDAWRRSFCHRRNAGSRCHGEGPCRHYECAGAPARAGRLHDVKLTSRFPQLRNIGVEYRWAGAMALTWNSVPAAQALEPGLLLAAPTGFEPVTLSLGNSGPPIPAIPA